MLGKRETLEIDFKSIEPALSEIAANLEENLLEIMEGVTHIDRIQTRVKGLDSLVDKAQSKVDGKFKYNVPLKEIQDLIGARIVVYYKGDVDVVREMVLKFYNTVEVHSFIPDSATKFGYEGFHTICNIPSPIYSGYRIDPLIPDFFELQVKTLYQHAWSQANHGLGYKPQSKLSYDEERKLAFIAAQSWGADSILSELTTKTH
ncbi:MAG TPA: RelA/SpoT domain-containing protein [Flavisolibacter sp.]|nr:RelA/SpoT domain-containing protein [Flavisolibacter sp.]